MRRGVTLVEVLVALLLVAVVGGALLRYMAFSTQVEAQASVRRGLADLVRFLSLRVLSADPAFLPPPGSAQRVYGYGQLKPLLAGAEGLSLANPDLYRVQVTEQQGQYLVEVCYRAPQEECFQVGGLVPLRSGRQETGQAQGTLDLIVEAPSAMTVVDVRVTGTSWSGSVNRPGSYALTLPPGRYRVEAQNVDVGGVMYSPDPQALEVNVSSGGRAEARLVYACASGSLRYTVTEGFTAALTGPVSRTLSGSGEMALPAGQYTVRAETPPEDYGYQVAVVPASGSFLLGPCQTQQVQVSYTPTKGRLLVEGTVEDYVLEGGAPRASVRPGGSSTAQTVDLPYSASLPPGSVSVTPLRTYVTVGSGANAYTVVLEPRNPGERQVAVAAGQDSRVSLVYRANPHLACVSVYDGERGVLFPGTYRLKVLRNGEVVMEETFSFQSSCRSLTLAPGLYTVEVERLQDPAGYRGRVALSASSTLGVSRSLRVDLYPSLALLDTYVFYLRPGVESGYDGRGGTVVFAAGEASFARQGSPFGYNPVSFSVPPQTRLNFSAQQDPVYLGTKKDRTVDYNYYWKLAEVTSDAGGPPFTTPRAGQTLRLNVTWALLRCQVAYPDRCQIWDGMYWQTFAR